MLRLSNFYTFPPNVFDRAAKRITWLRQKIQYEAHLNWCFIRRDMMVSLIPGFLFGTTALINYPAASLSAFVSIILKGTVYLWLCITTFCMCDQIEGIEEDRANKPERPLVVGLAKPSEARVRWIISMVCFTAFSWWTGTLVWAMIWQVGFLLYSFCGGAKHWYVKTFLGGIGITSEIGAAWQLVEPEILLTVWRWIAVICLYLITLMVIQDFRDIAGDLAIHRKTMPILFGETRSRYLVAAGYFGFPWIVHYSLMLPAGLTSTVIAWDLLLASLSVLIGLRLLIYRDPAADHKTYLGFTVWLCAYLASSIFILRV